jgi:hypothetical protein
MKEIKDHLNGVKDEYVKNSKLNVSFIQATRSKRSAENSFKKQKDEQKGRSGMLKKTNKQPINRSSLPTII